MTRADRTTLGAIASGLAALLLVALLVTGNAKGAEEEDGAPAVPRAQASIRQWLVPSQAATAPSAALAARAPVQLAHATSLPPRMRLGKRPSPAVLRTYFSCRAPALFLAPTLPPRCR